MKAYNIYNDNLNTIKKYLRNPGNDILILDLSNDTVTIGDALDLSDSTKILATKKTENVEEVRQTIIYWLWQQAEEQQTKKDLERFANNVPNFDIDDDAEFENIEDI